MKFKFLFYGFLNQNERIIQVLLSGILSIFFFYRYYKSENIILFLFAALLFLVTTVSGLVSLKRKTSILKSLNKAKIKLESTKASLFIYSDYKKYRNLVALLLVLSVSISVTLLTFYIQWKEDSINYLVSIFFIIALSFSFIIVIFIYYLFLPKITLQSGFIGYQLINFKQMSLFESIALDNLREVGIGKFEGYYYQHSYNNASDSFEKTYYWLLYGISHNKERHIFMDFDNNNKEVIFNDEWEKDMEKVYKILKERIPNITFNTQIRRLSNPNPHKGDKGWTDIGIIN